MIIITIVTYITVIIVLYIYNILQYILAVLLLSLILLSFITDTLSSHCVNFFICERSTQNLPKCTII